MGKILQVQTSSSEMNKYKGSNTQLVGDYQYQYCLICLKAAKRVNVKCSHHTHIRGFPSASRIKNLLAMQEIWVQPLGLEDPLQKRMATRSSILAWRLPWTE